MSGGFASGALRPMCGSRRRSCSPPRQWTTSPTTSQTLGEYLRARSPYAQETGQLIIAFGTTGWRSAPARDRWADNAKGLATDLRAVLGTRAELVVDLWPLDEKS
jgi:hypothetical protein